MKRYLFYFILVVLLVFILIFISDSDEVSWIRANMGNKSTDFAQYMKKHPDGWHFFEAQKHFDERSWKEAQEGGTLAHLRNYIKQNPEGLYVDFANELIEGLLWSQVNQKRNIEDYENFIKEYPNSQYVSRAEFNIEELFWKKAVSEKEIENVQAYLETYPDGKYITQAVELLENLIWNQTVAEDKEEGYLAYMKLFPDGKHYEKANSSLSRPLNAITIYIDSYHLYELTSFDKDYGYLFESKIKEIISEFRNVVIVPDISEAIVHLRIGYALSFREGQTGDDNISKFIENRLRDRITAKQERVKPTYDIGLHIYLWDIANDCLLAFSSSVTPPETGNAFPAREVGRDKFLRDQVEMHIDNSFVKFMGNLQKGKDNVMYLAVNDSGSFYRRNIGKPQKKVCVSFDNGPISVYHWRDPSLEKYIYFHLQQSDIDCVRTFDKNSYKLHVIWSKYNRKGLPYSVFREFGLKAEFLVYEKDKNMKDKLVMNNVILSDFNLDEYGILPIEVINQWRKVFDQTYSIDDIMKKLKRNLPGDEPEQVH